MPAHTERPAVKGWRRRRGHIRHGRAITALPGAAAARMPAMACALLLCATPASAQVIRGAVSERHTQVPIAAAQIQVRDSVDRTVATVTSSAEGGFLIVLPQPGTYVLRASHFGYTTATSEPLVLTRGEELGIEIRMSTDPVVLEPVTVLTRRTDGEPRLRDFYDRAERNRRIGRGHVMMREDIEALGAVRTGNLLTTLPGARNCRFTIFVDGQPVSGLREAEILAPPDALEGVEVYWDPAHVPVQYQPRDRALGTGCHATILLWRQPHAQLGNPPSWEKLVVAVGAVLALIFLLR